MKQATMIRDFESWRGVARSLLSANIEPRELVWTDSRADESLPMFDAPPTVDDAPALKVPAKFVELARQASCHRDTSRWTLLYRTLWRLTHGEPHLLDIVVDVD